LIQPFRIACPASCVGWRQGIESNEEPMYRMGMAWYLGQTSSYDPDHPDRNIGTAYDQGINYQCPIELVDAFSRANRTVVDGVLRGRAAGNYEMQPLQVTVQARIHLSLLYLCCLRANETDRVRESMYQWVMDRFPFNFTARFDKLECWKEQYNSVTNIIVADDDTQRIMTGIYLGCGSVIGTRFGLSRGWQCLAI